MLSRKQIWRRVRSRPRASADKGTKAKTTATARTAAKVVEPISSTSTSISTSMSFDSILSLDGDDLPASAGTPMVTFGPTVQVFFIENKRELDKSSKRALWWTPREAARNKRAWMKHIGSPGCGRESVGLLRQAYLSSTYGGWVSNHGETLGVLGCRCLACLTEGEDVNFFGKGSNSSKTRPFINV